jgi:hypothetical protein
VYSLIPHLLFVFRPDLVDWRQVERICVLSHPLERICVLSDPLFVYRPDLVDWRQVERRQVRERIDLAFHVMDREYGVTRLLDPEGKPMKKNDKSLDSSFSDFHQESICIPNHRVHTEWQLAISGVHSIMMEKSALAGEDGGARPPSFTQVTITYKGAVYLRSS